MPQTALLCNLVVVCGGCWFFIKGGHFSLRRVLPFVVSSIPMAYYGGTVPIGKKLFTLLLGISLAVAALRMLLSGYSFERRTELSWRNAWVTGIPIGAVLGFFSGLVGIGGGIYLSPLLMILGWADSKEAAAAASFFILVNSMAGLIGQFSKSGLSFEISEVLPLLVAVFLGGQIGSRLGSQKLPRLAIQRITALLILYISGRLLLQK